MNEGLRVTLKPTGNKKLVGDNKRLPFYATYREVGMSCPSTCALLNNGCYAQFGHVAIQMHGQYSDNDGDIFLRELNRIPQGAALRLHVSGDVMRDGGKDGSNVLDVEYLNALIEGAKRRPDVSMYGYTHAWRQIDRNEFVFPSNLTLNASCDTQEDVAEARAAGWDTTTVVPAETPGKRYGDTVVCQNKTTGLTCDKCRLCFKSNRSLTVAFKAHGVSKRKVSKRASLPTA